MDVNTLSSIFQRGRAREILVVKAPVSRGDRAQQWLEVEPRSARAVKLDFVEVEEKKPFYFLTSIEYVFY